MTILIKISIPVEISTTISIPTTTTTSTNTTTTTITTIIIITRTKRLMNAEGDWRSWTMFGALGGRFTSIPLNDDDDFGGVGDDNV